MTRRSATHSAVLSGAWPLYAAPRVVRVKCMNDSAKFFTSQMLSLPAQGSTGLQEIIAPRGLRAQ